MKYCEGSSKAEIIFSLTGGREGKLVSNSPPVEIFIADKAVKWSIYKNVPTPGYSAADRADLGLIRELITLADRFNENTNTRTLTFTYTGMSRKNTPNVETLGFFSYRGIYELDYVNNIAVINKTWNPLINSTRVIWEDAWFAKPSSRNDLAYWNYYDEVKENVFCIQDTSGVLYFHQIPKGFTPTWQVTCIGCQQGECAGSDGKGGVICMDCKQMDSDIQFIKKSLSK